MTVCIAAICLDDDDGSACAVVAADRMVTLGNFMEFEHTVPKMDRPSDTSVVMVAGDTLVGTRMANDVCQQLRGSSPRIADIAAAMALQYTTARSQIAEQFFLIPRGLNWARSTRTMRASIRISPP